MRRALTLSAALLSLSSVLLIPTDVEACGGCFHGTDLQQSEATQVTGHRMVLSVSPQQSTLYDQMEYDGEPQDFAWVLPVKGLATVGLSSDALLGTLDSLTGVTVVSPTVNCPPSSCGSSSYASTATSTASTGSGGGVTVVSQSVVGPYETVQLSAADPQALVDWLSSHGYVIPPEIEPIVASYVAEQFDFLALKLVPGGPGIKAIRPVRVTTPGASPVLPLRMVAAGAGVTTPITLWVIGEGRYEPKNFPSFQIGQNQIVWNWDTQSSNYKELKAAQFAASGGSAWLIEAGEEISYFSVEYPLYDLVSYYPEESGYGDVDGTGAEDELNEDLQTLFAGIDLRNLWVTRLYAELSKAALANDLTVGASASQTWVDRYLQASNTVGAAPTCPPDPCAGDSSSGSAFTTSATGGMLGSGGASSDDNVTTTGGCAIGNTQSTTFAGLVLTGMAALLLGRKRGRRS